MNNMFSRVVLRRIDPAASTHRPGDIENQPLSPRESPEPEMSEQLGTNGSPGRMSRFRPRRPSIPSRFRFSNSTTATSAAGSVWPGPLSQTAAQQANANTHPALRPSSSHYPEEDDDNDSVFDRTTNRESTLPSRYSVIVDLPSTRLHLPGLQRTWTSGSNGPPTGRPHHPHEHQQQHESMRVAPPSPPPDSPACRPHTPPSRYAPVPAISLEEPPRAARTRLGSEEADELYAAGDRRARGAFTDPAEAHLADMARDGRQRRHGSGSSRRNRRGRHANRGDETPEEREARRRRRRERRQRLRDIEDDEDEEGGGSATRPHPKHFLFCFPWVKSRKIRSQILQCFVSGTFLVLLLSVYLALTATRNIANTEFSVLLILIILFATIFFCQGLIRVCLLAFRPKPTADERRRSRLPQMYGPSGYAVPRQPIRVVLARDEEAVGIESDATKTNPPAYGLWRESVRVDPNRIFWQRNADAPAVPDIEVADVVSSEHEGESSSDAEESGTRSRSTAGVRRPPSYASEDGVSYIIEARPRSTLPVNGPEIMAMPSPLPMHPSEMGRVATPPSR